MSEEHPSDTNSELLFALKTSLCDGLADLTGKALPLEEQNVVFTLLKSLVQLGAEQLIDKKFDPKTSALMPIDVGVLLKPPRGVMDPPDPVTGTTAISRKLEQVEQRGKEQGYPVVLGFGWYQRMAEYVAKGIRDSGHDPFDPDLWERAVEYKGGDSRPEGEAPRPVEFK